MAINGKMWATTTNRNRNDMCLSRLLHETHTRDTQKRDQRDQRGTQGYQDVKTSNVVGVSTTPRTTPRVTCWRSAHAPRWSTLESARLFSHALGQTYPGIQRATVCTLRACVSCVGDACVHAGCMRTVLIQLPVLSQLTGRESAIVSWIEILRGEFREFRGLKFCGGGAVFIAGDGPP